MNSAKGVAAVMVFIALAWLASCVADQVRPESPAPESYYPAAGQVIHSRAEGFTSQVIQTDGESAWIELRIAPHAPGRLRICLPVFPKLSTCSRYTLLRPLGRLLENGCYYERFAPGPRFGPESAAAARDGRVDMASMNKLVSKGDENMTHIQDEEQIRKLVATFINGWNSGAGRHAHVHLLATAISRR